MEPEDVVVNANVVELDEGLDVPKDPKHLAPLCKIKFLTDLPISLYQWTYLICGQFSLPNKGLRDALLKKKTVKEGDIVH